MSRRQQKVNRITVALIVVLGLVAGSVMWMKGNVANVAQSDFVVASDFDRNPLDLERRAEFSARPTSPADPAADSGEPRADASRLDVGLRPIPVSPSAVADSDTQSDASQTQSAASGSPSGAAGNPLSAVAPSAPGAAASARSAGRSSTPPAGFGSGGSGSGGQQAAAQALTGSADDADPTETARASGSRVGVQSLNSGLPGDLIGAPPPASAAPVSAPPASILPSGSDHQPTGPQDEVFPTLLRLLDETSPNGAPGGTTETGLPGQTPAGTLSVAPPNPLVVNPEPGTLLLLGTGLFAAGRRMRRR